MAANTKRIYELAKDYKISSHAMLKIVQELGFTPKSHMSVAPPDMINAVSLRFAQERQQAKKKMQEKADAVAREAARVKAEAEEKARKAKEEADAKARKAIQLDPDLPARPKLIKAAPPKTAEEPKPRGKLRKKAEPEPPKETVERVVAETAPSAQGGTTVGARSWEAG